MSPESPAPADPVGAGQGDGTGGLVEVLAAHRVTPVHSSGPDCNCGWFQTWPRQDQHSEGFAKQHAAHVAAEVATWVREIVAEAWDDGFDAGDQTARAVNAEYPGATPNPLRAALGGEA